jgi:hypothetical protein
MFAMHLAGVNTSVRQVITAQSAAVWGRAYKKAGVIDRQDQLSGNF